MRKISGMLLMILLAFALAACGGDDNDDEDDAEATEPPAATEVEEEATEAEEEGTPEEEAAATAVADDDEDATPAAGASPVAGDDATPVTDAEATPAGMDATPVSGLDAVPEEEASPVASPVDESEGATPTSAVVPGDVETGATPSGVVSPVASPETDVESTPEAADVAVPPAADEDAGTPEEALGETISLQGEVRIEGEANQAWIMTDDGCVGLGNHADMQSGRQVVVRDANGTIVGATDLEAAETAEECAWIFGLDVPESEFYAVSIPMKMELVFSQEDVAENDGEITLILP